MVAAVLVGGLFRVSPEIMDVCPVVDGCYCGVNVAQLFAAVAAIGWCLYLNIGSEGVGVHMSPKCIVFVSSCYLFKREKLFL